MQRLRDRLARANGHAPLAFGRFVQAPLDPPHGRNGTSGEPRRPRRRLAAVWISDLHLGTRGCQSAMLLEFLESVRCDRLYLVGDVVDGWSLRRSWYWDDAHNRIVERILAMSSEGTRVTLVCGNHDEFLRRYLGVELGGVLVTDEAVHVTRAGKRLLVLHGDQFDVVIRNSKWLARLGSKAYALALRFNTLFNRVRLRLGYPYWSISAYLKGAVKNAVSYIASFEHAVVREARRRGFDGVVCGHIHKAALRDVDGVLYCNDGDWVESCTALAETRSGALELVHWAEETRLSGARSAPARLARRGEVAHAG